jgi:hypothetical protein
MLTLYKLEDKFIVAYELPLEFIYFVYHVFMVKTQEGASSDCIKVRN